jgi:flagellar FliJ protein
MKRFQFRLDPVLRHRENLEEQEKNKLAQINFRLESEVRRLLQIETEQIETRERLRTLRLDSGDPRESSWYDPYLKRLAHEAQEVRKRIDALRLEHKTQKETLMEASKKRKVIDTLKTRRRKEYSQFCDKEEQRNVDEIVVTRYSSRKD